MYRALKLKLKCIKLETAPIVHTPHQCHHSERHPSSQEILVLQVLQDQNPETPTAAPNRRSNAQSYPYAEMRPIDRLLPASTGALSSLPWPTGHGPAFPSLLWNRGYEPVIRSKILYLEALKPVPLG